MTDSAISVSTTDRFAQRRDWQPFMDASIEKEYRAWYLDQVLAGVRWTGLAALVLWVTIAPLWEVFAGVDGRFVRLNNWGFVAPTMVVILALTYTRLRMHIGALASIFVLAQGLDLMWFMGTLYGPADGSVMVAAMLVIALPAIGRFSTAWTALIAVIITTVQTALLVTSMTQGDMSLAEAWRYFALLTAVPLTVIPAAAFNESGLRRQFVAESTVQASQLLLRRYVPEQVADAVTSGTAMEQHERRKLTIFFSDLVGFTDLSEELEPEDLATVLHDYFTEMSAIAKRHGGTVDDLVGDAILVLFGAPERTDDKDQALRAVRMAVEMQEAMGSLNQRWASAGIPETLIVRMGINTGVATVGNFGSAERTKYTALGKQVNIAARIQAQCEPGRVLIGHTTWLLVRDEIACTPKGELTLKGLTKPMPAYEVVSSQPR